MAKVSGRRGKIASIRTPQGEESATATAVMEPPTPFDAPSTPEPSPPVESEPARRGRPPANANPNRPPKLQTFMQRIAGIALEDWGTRAKIRLYRLAPIIDRTRGSEVKFLTAYEETVDEERIKHDWGSGRYRLYLGFKMPGENEKELDSVEFDIMDMKFPPVVPPGEWVEDHRNKQWAWAKAHFPAPPTNGTPAPPVSPANSINDFVDVLRATNDMRREIREELQPNTPTPAPVAPQADSLTQAVNIAEKFMQMRSENPMVDVLRDEMKAMREELRAERDANRQLQTEIRQAQAAPAAAAEKPKTLLEQITELGALKETLGKLWGMGGEAAATVATRPSRFAWMSEVGDIVERAQPILTPLAEGLGHWLSTARNPAAPQVNGNGAPPIQAPANDPMRQFVQQVITPAMMSHFESGDTGEDFAAWLYNGFPRQFDQFQHFKHPMLPGKEGAEAIVEAYKHTDIWPKLQGREAQFRTFVSEFCAWAKPEEEDAQDIEATTVEASGDVIDFDAEEEQPQ